MQSLRRSPGNRVPVACLLLCALHGCRSAPAPQIPAAANPELPHFPSTAPASGPRTDGVYECRGIENATSSGGWRFLHIPGQSVRVAHFVRFYPSGHARYGFSAREPFTTGQAVRYLDSLRQTGQPWHHPDPRDESRIRFAMGDRASGGPVVQCEGKLVGDELTLRCWSEDVPPETNVFRFAKWP